MNIKELKEAIKDLPDDLEIILQKDAEGNGYSPLEGVDFNAVYIQDSSYSGEVYDRSWSADDADMDQTEWEKILSKPIAVVMYPIN